MNDSTERARQLIQTNTYIYARRRGLTPDAADLMADTILDVLDYHIKRWEPKR